MKRLSRTALAVVTATGLGLGALTVPAYAQENTVELNILGITDFHGHLAQNDRDQEAGIAGIACYAEAERAENPLTSFVTVGDNIGGSPFVSSILKDTPTLSALNAIGVDASALGNHEFDRGYSDLTGRVSVDGTGEAQFPYLGANVVGGVPAPAGSEIMDLDGVKVGYVGAVTEETATLVSPAGIPGITFTDDIASLNAEAARIAGDVDVVIALVHSGASANDAFSNDIDVVFAGHTHQNRVETGPAREGKQPLVVIQGWEYGKAVSDVEITFDRAAGEITNIEARNVLADEILAACDSVPGNAVVAAVQNIVTAAVDASAEAGNEVVTTIENSFYRGANEEGGYGGNRGVESSLNNLLAEAGLWGMNELTALSADIGVMNAGGVRADLAAGPVTFADAYAVQPFGNTYGVVDITGAQFKEALEQQWKQPTGERPRLALGLSNNVQYSYDETRPAGDRVTHITVNGEPIDLSATYRVAGASFLLSGGDGFTALAAGSDMLDSGMVDIDLFNRYLAAHPGAEIRNNHSSVGISLEGGAVAEDGSLIAGEDLTINLSSLSYTGGEAKPTTVTVTLGDQEADADVDNTLLPQYDNTGTATVTLTVPAGATEISLATDAGTTFTLPVTVAGELVDDQPSTGSSTLELVGIAGIIAAVAGIAGFIFNAVMGGALPATLAQIQALAGQFM
ncbi:5'-nucleotidase, C-terminal domain protein [Corynebacterium efficiens YS-314]|uniref:5'-nucleotidase n=1 Tax=Corynebacterium efficiens (strain DSM 44549 / YS-314 / AJ 12310 / JCM 11189 / NBRC 100395) TaxID=196164 RepID=Q8FSP5_COREF|nr:bifunctional UDP-sugar hydrolase/5'-nucleotidase [Corynebacterium efficiens]EEW50884.1 5'-nucleotidase, C-terminal domain protein [Corynebacterium efficiens YS-314]BAC17147.1 5'-nucleotidase [Corynebacterium efficiens YS-314]